MNEFLEKFLRKSLEEIPGVGEELWEQFRQNLWKKSGASAPAEILEKNVICKSRENSLKKTWDKFWKELRQECRMIFKASKGLGLESYGTTAIWWSLFIRQPKHKVTRGSLEIQQRIVLMHIGEFWYTSAEHSAVGIEMCVWWPHNWTSSNAELHRRDVTKKPTATEIRKQKGRWVAYATGQGDSGWSPKMAIFNDI